MRYFAGLSIPDIAEAIGVTARTVDRDWFAARAWLRQRLRPVLCENSGRGPDRSTSGVFDANRRRLAASELGPIFYSAQARIVPCTGPRPSGTLARWTRCLLRSRLSFCSSPAGSNRQQQTVIDYLLEEN